MVLASCFSRRFIKINDFSVVINLHNRELTIIPRPCHLSEFQTSGDSDIVQYIVRQNPILVIRHITLFQFSDERDLHEFHHNNLFAIQLHCSSSVGALSVRMQVFVSAILQSTSDIAEVIDLILSAVSWYVIPSIRVYLLDSQLNSSFLQSLCCQPPIKQPPTCRNRIPLARNC